MNKIQKKKKNTSRLTRKKMEEKKRRHHHRLRVTALVLVPTKKTEKLNPTNKQGKKEFKP